MTSSMDRQMIESRYLAVSRAIAWLRQNPDKHGVDYYAHDEKLKSCLPHKEEAICYCALGRIAKQAGLDPTKDYTPSHVELVNKVELQSRQWRLLEEYLAPLGIKPAEISDINDDEEINPSKTARLHRIDELLAGRVIAAFEGLAK